MAATVGVMQSSMALVSTPAAVLGCNANAEREGGIVRLPFAPLAPRRAPVFRCQAIASPSTPARKLRDGPKLEIGASEAFFSFDGAAPETINGRMAMLGFAWAFIAEKATDARSCGAFNARAERWNGRLAMIGFAALIIDEMLCHSPVFH
ncbi:unnamed protein product [Calypogeia fissa]